MKTSSKALALRVPYDTIKNISGPEDRDNGRVVYAGQMPITAVIDLPTNDNVRGYLVEAEGKQRRTPTQVHKAIKETLRERPDQFSVLNGGIVIVARSSEIDEKNRILSLTAASIINGSQTQGVIKDFLQKQSDATPVHLKFELIVTADDELIADISIARNFQNDVESLSIAGRKGQIDELESSLQRTFPDIKLQKSETQLPSAETDYWSTEKLLQVIAALLPAELWWKAGEFNKAYTYRSKATCLKDFQQLYKAKHDEDPTDSVVRLAAVYDFYIEMAPTAYKLYNKWKQHQGFQGTGLRAIERNGREILDVPDALVFPILAALANFAIRKKGKWIVEQPQELEDSELISAAKRVYIEIARSRPEIMGKTKACYSALEQITSIYRKLLNRAG